ncbi:MAG: long-chain fatty acid--CoA ligase, partial [Calditrichaeota bacterium]|nr:long-chain fatty acid--CoA ligase [Calditrichota bacterium]
MIDIKEHCLTELLINSAARYPDRISYMEKENGVYQSYTYTQILDKMYTVATALIKRGFEAGERVALLSNNSIRWALVDYACQATGIVDVPIYPTLLTDKVEFILKDSGARCVFVQNKEQLDKVLSIATNEIPVELIVTFDNETASDKRVITFDEFIKEGDPYDKDAVHKRMDAVKILDMATIIYTSGTTGIPKGVMLSHQNFLHNVTSALNRIDTERHEIFMSFLPLSHVYERMFGHYFAQKIGSTIAFAESIDALSENIKEVRPTIMASVPRLYEKINARIMDGVEQSPPLKQKIFFWALKVGKEVVNNYTSIGKKPSGLLAIKFAIADKLIFSKLKAAMGGRLKLFISGGGTLKADIGEFFNAAGLQILEGYGLTETSPVICVNEMDHFKFGYVGPPLDEVEVKIAEDGEILTRGKHVMMGYYNDPAATKEAIDADGWFHTGDIGELDEDGFLKITDRKKDVFKTSNGKMITPLPIENELKSSKYIEQAVVIGNARKFCSAIIVAAEEPLQKFAKQNGIDLSTAELCQHPKIQELFQSEIDQINHHLARYETIKKFILKAEPF